MAGAFKKSDIEILLSTMHRDSLDFLIPMFPFAHFSEFKILIINQTSPDKQLISPYPGVRVVNSFETGLSKSRNLALSNATGILCVISDDDVVFKPGLETAILTAFNETPAAALIAFRAENGAGQPYKKYPLERVSNPPALKRLSIMSIEMVVNKKSIDKYKIKFDERFGLGSPFIMGEEAIFVNTLYQKPAKIVMEPATIVAHNAADTHSRIPVAGKYYVQGALFSALYGSGWIFWVLLKLAFEIKNKKIKLSRVISAIKAARNGRKAYLKT
ncbi:glycosyltransferase [Flavobacterium sp. RHBU_24]|uniref:glycosyltransferase n=1 Tax=Flavobacterium sp. RHBU_24 TaxID=3391185 RepID=UPI0039853B41